MILTKIPLQSVISVEPQQNSHAPLNLRFSKSKLLSSGTLQSLAGPGIYLIQFDDEVCYLGKYRPIGGKILTDRWLRHIETLTIRGRRVGFGGATNPLNRLEKLTASLKSAELKQQLYNLYEVDKLKRFKDTGVNTSINRLGFADEHWDYFSRAEAGDILDRFTFTLLKMGNQLPQADASSTVSLIEERALALIKPIANDEYSAQQHSNLRAGNSKRNAIDLVESVADQMGVFFSHCTDLSGRMT